MSPIDPVLLALSIGATFVARGFSGDKEQLIPILNAALAHTGLALIDVISPCVTFNDHSGSTKSYLYTRNHELRATETDFVPPAQEILATIGQNGGTHVTMHDGSILQFKSVPEGYDPTDRQRVMSYLLDQQKNGEIVTGLLFIDQSTPDLHEANRTSQMPLARLPFETLCPGATALDKLQDDFR
jgi:2-oxoglutarate ferredoxin oxidoreductase subunit beta